MSRGQTIIDLSNWPNHNKFISGLPNDVNDYTEAQWLNLVIPNQDAGGLTNNSPQKANDNFLAIRRKLTDLNLLARYEDRFTPEEITDVIDNLHNPDIIMGIKPHAAALLGLSFQQLNQDTHALGDQEGPGRVNLDGDHEKTVAFFNVMMCCLSEIIVKEGRNYSQADSWFGPVSIANNLWPILIGSNETKEFKLYLLIKIFYFDSKLYKFISPIGEYPTMQYGTTVVRAGNPVYQVNTLAPPHVYRLFILHLWLRNKKASQYNALSKQNKIGFCNSFFEVMKGEIIATQFGSLGDDGSIKTLLANYLMNRDPIYLYSAVLSPFTNPTSIFPGFDDISDSAEELTSVGLLEDAPVFINSLFMFFATWKQSHRNTGDLDIRTTLDLDYIETLYKALSKPVIFKKRKMSKFIKSIALFKKQFIPIVNLSPKFISKVENMDNNIYNNNDSLIKWAGFYIKPIKSGYAGNSTNNKIYIGGKKKYTRKKSRRKLNKTRKLY